MSGGSGGAGELIGGELLVDPYGHAPLVAVVNVHGVELDSVTNARVVVLGKDGAPDFEREYAPQDLSGGGELDVSDLPFSEAGVAVPVLGLYADARSTVEIVIERGSEDPVELAFDVQALLTRSDEAVWVPTMRVTTADTAAMEPGWTVAEVVREPSPPPPEVIVDFQRALAFDEQGAVRWALRTDDLPPGETFTVTRSARGTLLTGAYDTIVELTRLGRTVQSMQLEDYTLHHEILEIGSSDPQHGTPRGGTESEFAGQILVLATKTESSTVQDHVLQLDLETGTVTASWDLGEVLDTTRTTLVDPEEWSPGVNDWLHANGLAYAVEDESIVVSGRHQGVVKLRRDGTLAWLLAPHEGWKSPQSDKLLTAVDASGTPYEENVQLGHEPAGEPTSPEFAWAFGQHSPSLLPNGDLLLFDNGAGRYFETVCGSLSRAVVFRVDAENMTVRQMGQYILSKADSSCLVSNTHFLPLTGHLFIQPGSSYFDTGSSSATVRELVADVGEDGMITFGDVVFDAKIDLSVIMSGSFAYSFRGHRWTF